MTAYSSTTKLGQATALATSMAMTTPARESLRGRLSHGAQWGAKPLDIDMISGRASDATHRVLLSEVKRGLRSLVRNHILRAGALCQLEFFSWVVVVVGGHLPEAEMEEVVEIK